MTNLVQRNKLTVKTSGGLHARIAEKELLDETVKVDLESLPNRLAVLTDCSGSMAGDKINLLKDALQDFINRTDTSSTALALESFPTGTRVSLTNDKTQLWLNAVGVSADGDTPMGHAMNYAREAYKLTRIIIISDGDATDGDDSIMAAKQFAESLIACDCVHIGDSTRGEDRLREIAKITGGLYIKFKDVKSFSQSFHYLLPETRSLLLLPEARSVLNADEVR